MLLLTRLFIILLLLTASVVTAEQSPATNRNRLQLSLDLALRVAIRNNIETRIAKLTLKQAKNSLAGSLREFNIRPYLTADLDLYGPDEKTHTGKIGMGIRKKISTIGTDLTLAIESSVYGNMRSSYGYDPAYKSGLVLTLSQPLLQGAGQAYTRYGYNTARWTIQEKRLALRGQLSRLIRDTELAYWKHLYAIRKARIARISLKLASQLLEMNQLRVKIGLLSATDLIEARSVQALREEELLRTVNEVNGTRDDLLTLLHLDKKPISSVMLTTPPGTPGKIEAVPELLSTAFRLNPDYRLSAIEKKQNKLTVAYYRNLIQPELNLDLNLSAFGQDKRLAPSLAPGDYSISIGLRLTLPWGSDAKERHANAKLTQRIHLLKESGLQRDISNSIHTAARNINNAASRIIAAGKAQELAKKRLELTTRKYALKLTSNTDVLQAQKDYLEAILAYEKAVLEHNEEKARLYYRCGLNFKKNSITIK